MALPAKNRIKNKKDFDLVFKKGRTVKGSFLFIKAAANKHKVLRFGFLIPKNIISRATARNRLKRVLSETAGDLIREQFLRGYDIAVVIRKNKSEKTLIGELNTLLSDLKIKN